MIPSNLILFRFPGFGPELSHGLAVKTRQGRIVMTDAASNPGTSMTNAIEMAVPMVLRTLDVDSSPPDVFQWTPRDPLKPDSVWRVQLVDSEPTWEAVDWSRDDDLTSAVDALRAAVSGGPVLNGR